MQFSRSRFGPRTQLLPVIGRKLRWMNSLPGGTAAMSFPGGINSYADNDDVKPTQVVYASDARMTKIGRYKTRQGADRYTVPIGEASNVAQTSTTGASTVAVSSTNYIGWSVIPTTTGRATRLDLTIKSQAGVTGTVVLELHSSLDVLSSSLLARTSIAASAITTTATSLSAYFMDAPLLTSGTTYYVIARGQASNLGSYLVSTTTAASTLSTSTNSGVSWSSTATAPNFNLWTSTDAPVQGMIRVYRVGGQKLTILFHNNSAYTVNDTNGTTTLLKSGMNSSATTYRAALVQDTLYWVNGQEQPWKYDFTTVSQVTTSPYNPSLITEHKGMLFYVDANDKTRLFYTNFGLYDTFTSTDFIYVPAPKSYDSLTALSSLNGVLYIFANRNKFSLLGSDDSTFRLDQAVGSKGTFSQESVAQDQNHMYFASDDGIYESNGTQETNIAQPVIDWYLALTNKSSMVLQLYNNRLYCYYTPVGSGLNTNCKVYNTLLKIWESDDTNVLVGRTLGRQTPDNLFILGSNRVGALYWGELSTNDYNSLGNVLNFEIRTNYSHFGSPGLWKRITMWRPKFMGQSGQYNGQAGYAFDLQDSPTYVDVPMGTSGPQTDTGLLTDNGVTVGGVALVEPTQIQINGKFKRVQRRYQHIAAREPIEIDSEMLQMETQRPI